MSANIKTIKLTLWLSGIFLIATFLVTLSDFYRWINKIEWINDFLLVCFSGIFASSFVVLLCEIRSYKTNKVKAEDELYDYCVEILARFISAKTALQSVNKNKKMIISKGLLNDLQQHVAVTLDKYFQVDFITYNKRNSLYNEHLKFKGVLIKDVQQALRDCAYLDIAINEAQISNLSMGITANNVTTENLKVSETINALINEFDSIISKISSFAEKIDYSCSFNFKERFSGILEGQDKYKAETYEEFLKRNS